MTIEYQLVPDKSFTVEVYRNLTKAHCYGIFRDGLCGPECLYIGASKVGFKRLLNHDIIGKRFKLHDCYEIRIWYIIPEYLLDYERFLKYHFKPKFCFDIYDSDESRFGPAPEHYTEAQRKRHEKWAKGPPTPEFYGR